ncbi:hypothetical protein MN608_10295 [Microdochium nivale]|nr:hypothetical protein MN608_10295 [Microdochium nivale]
MRPSVVSGTIRSRERTTSPPPRLTDRRFLETSLRPSLRSSIPNESDIELGSVRTNSARHTPTFHHQDEHGFDALRSRSASLDVATPSIEQQQARAAASSSSAMYQDSGRPQPAVHRERRHGSRSTTTLSISTPRPAPPPPQHHQAARPHGPRPNPRIPIARDSDSFGSYQRAEQAGEDNNDQEAKKARLAADRQGVLQSLADCGISHPSYAAYATGSNRSSSPPSPSSSSLYSTTTATPRGSTSAIYRGASGTLSNYENASAHAGGSAGHQTVGQPDSHAHAYNHPGHSRGFSANVLPVAINASHDFLPSAAHAPSSRSVRDFSYSTTPPRMTGAAPTPAAPASTHPGGYADRNPYRGGHGVIASNRNAPGGSASLIEAGEWFGNNNGGLATPVRGRGSGRASDSGSDRRAGSVGGRGGGARLHHAQTEDDEYDEYYGNGDGVGNKGNGKGKEVKRY